MSKIKNVLVISLNSMKHFSNVTYYLMNKIIGNKKLCKLKENISTSTSYINNFEDCYLAEIIFQYILIYNYSTSTKYGEHL